MSQYNRETAVEMSEPTTPSSSRYKVFEAVDPRRAALAVTNVGKGFFTEFVKFLERGSVVDLAVGLVMGTGK